MSTITSDRDLLAALGLTEAQAADFLDRSRQTLNASLSSESKRTKYFRPVDVFVLRMAAKAAGNVVNDQAIVDYVRSCWGSAKTEKVLARFNSVDAELDLRNEREVWAIIPDFPRLWQANPDLANLLARLAIDCPNTDIIFLCGTPVNEDMLRDFVDKAIANHSHGRVHYVTDNLIASQQTMLIASPQSNNPRVFVPISSGFVETLHSNGSQLAYHLARAVTKLKDLPQSEDASDIGQVRKKA
jgi:hypothetical protein